jgi:phosphate transport system substrate-binding protein
MRKRMGLDAPGGTAYPIVVTVFAQIRKSIAAGRARDTLNFFRWSLDKGEKDAADLGYVPLPQELVTQVKQYWAKNLRAGS